MVIDASPFVAIVLGEPDASVYVSAILNDSTRLISAASLLEASMVVMEKTKGDAIAVLDNLIRDLRVTVIAVDHEQALIAREAFRQFGKGRHPAKLNFGDCFSYALAKVKGEALLFKGNDFNQPTSPSPSESTYSTPNCVNKNA